MPQDNITCLQYFVLVSTNRNVKIVLKINIPVIQSPSKNPFSKRKRMIAGVPPIYYYRNNL